ncbi:hypothetical protein CYLTODRAFT_416544 [Cylindrobasidium torrendii FP15055 ss-10]|uniref:Protein kinase domain-containing protein n=1 Tax=Cylindrobasidium torrendii FP15055 ss-10 TaxID=1314674 RepID=A0A0D7BUH1_9AGAR|nr:hypothetical protein CYLTODRAFT_416544 [Cylindrobasidium torrendii FP15055 ss-10]
MTIKAIVFEVNYTIWSGKLDAQKWGKGRLARTKPESNLERDASDKHIVRDSSDYSNQIRLFSDIPKIIHDIKKRHIPLGFVSKDSPRAMCDRALYFFEYEDENHRSKPIIEAVNFDETGHSSYVDIFNNIKGWASAQGEDILFFDCHAESLSVHRQLGVQVEIVDSHTGVTWETYNRALEKYGHSGDHKVYRDQPKLGGFLGDGKFSKVYDAADDRTAVVKVLNNWTEQQSRRLLEIYKVIKTGRPFDPGEVKLDQYLLMIALELRNLALIKELMGPKPEEFSGWFKMQKIAGTHIWKHPLYTKHPFSVEWQEFVRACMHRTVDQVEHVVKEYGVEHCDAHFRNVVFNFDGDKPTKAHLLDWGIAVKMTWDGNRYIRGNDFQLIVPKYQKSKPGLKYTPDEFRRYWITWMVKTEYAARWERNVITERDGQEFLKDLSWWYRRR